MLAASLVAVTASPGGAAPVCVISSITPLAFDATYDPFVNRPTDGRASFTITCSRPAMTVLSLFYTHRLAGSSLTGLQYDLFATPDRAAIWGNGSDGATVTRSFADGSPTTVFVYGRIPPHQKVPPGRLNDSFLVQVQSL
jgi:spore coat protein U-like protein